MSRDFNASKIINTTETTFDIAPIRFRAVAPSVHLNLDGRGPKWNKYPQKFHWHVGVLIGSTREFLSLVFGIQTSSSIFLFL